MPEANSEFVDDENDLHHVCVRADYNKLNLCLVDNNLVRFYERFEIEPIWLTHRVISDRVHRLLVTLSYFRPDRFVQLLSLIPILILLLYLLVSGCLTSLC